MVDYSKSQIYELSYDGYYYVGSTTKSLKKRFKNHQNDYKSYLRGTIQNCSTSQYILEKCFDCHKRTIQLYPCKNKKELSIKEGEYIKNYKKKYGDKCVNKCIAGRTQREYRNDTKHIKDEHDKKYRKNNKQKIKNSRKIYREKNRDKLLKVGDKYRQENRELIRKKDRIRYLYTKTWGGDKKYNNNLLTISMDLFH